MPLLNPYLRAFFRSTLPAQCTPVQDYILLVPTTEILTSSRDRESGLLLSDLAGNDEFLGSHVLRIPSAGSGSPMVGARENRGKARQFTTFNGRTVVIKDSSIYTNKGFRSLIQTQLLNDILYYPDTSDPQQWLVYFINRPLIGSLEQIPITPPLLRERPSMEASSGAPSRTHGPPKKKDIKSFNELLMLFPMIARQMQPGLEKLFQDFEISFEKYKPLPLPPSPSSQSIASGISSKASTHSSVNGDLYKQAADEAEIRKSLESAITAAVDLFQRIDQTHLNHLSSSTDLTGPAIDRLIERYVAEQLHEGILFPRICATKGIEDEELELKILDMENVDLSQVGIPFLDQQEKASLVKRLTAGIKCFEKIGIAKSPQSMMELLLETAQILTRSEEESTEKKGDISSQNSSVKTSEKAMSSTVVTMNADMLVSLLLIVVIRAKVPNLHACLTYMRNFIFVEDVEQGETGYILSTLEAVLFHIAQDHSLSAASRANERLWRSVRSGDLLSVKRLLEPVEGRCSNAEEDEEDEDESINKDTVEEMSAKVTVEVSSPEEKGVWANDESSKDFEGTSHGANRAEAGLGELRARSPFNPGHGKASPAMLSPTISSKVPGSGSLPGGILSKDSGSIETASLDGQVESVGESSDTSEALAIATDDSEAFVDPFESSADKSSRAVGISNIRLDDVRTDGLDDSDSLSGILRVPSLKLNTSISQNGAPRAGMARFDLVDHSSVKFPRSRSAISLATTIGDISTFSKLSRTGTSQSQSQDAISIEKLSKTRNAAGDSVLMMAVQERKPDVLRYLLGTQFFDVDFLLEDYNNDGTTLLSAAIQLENMEIVEVLLKELLPLSDEVLMKCFALKDNSGRTVAHYLFNTPDLIWRLGQLLPWKSKDKNGQTPLFALCRSYDHHRYREMVGMAIKYAQASQKDGRRLHLDDHVDSKGNTLLHIAGDPAVLKTLLKCDSEVNAVNDRGFTALMVASKYGRLEMVRAFFTDPRVDLLAKDLRGLTAVELAKDDDVRNRIDDLVLFQNSPTDDGRVTAVVRSFFVEDATIRVVLKSGAPSGDSTFTITTCRRSLADFQFLAEWLSYENPASWVPTLLVPRSPYQIPSKPSRSVLRDIQLRLDNFIRTLLSHSTFSTHELLWEFFLVPDIQQELMIERSKKKAETRIEKIREEFTPVEDTRDVETFVSYAKDSVRSINYACRSVTRRGMVLRTSLTDLSDAYKLSVKHLSGFKFLQETPHLTALTRLSDTLVPNESHPFTLFLEDFRNVQASLNGVMTALDRPKTIISEMSGLHKQIDKHILSLRRSDRWPLGLLDDTRAKIHQDAAEKVAKTKEEYLALASELRYTQSIAAQELAGFHELHEKQVKRAVRTLAKRQVVAEKARLEAMKRAVRGVLGER